MNLSKTRRSSNFTAIDLPEDNFKDKISPV